MSWSARERSQQEEKERDFLKCRLKAPRRKRKLVIVAMEAGRRRLRRARMKLSGA